MYIHDYMYDPFISLPYNPKHLQHFFAICKSTPLLFYIKAMKAPQIVYMSGVKAQVVWVCVVELTDWLTDCTVPQVSGGQEETLDQTASVGQSELDQRARPSLSTLNTSTSRLPGRPRRVTSSLKATTQPGMFARIARQWFTSSEKVNSKTVTSIWVWQRANTI